MNNDRNIRIYTNKKSYKLFLFKVCHNLTLFIILSISTKAFTTLHTVAQSKRGSFPLFGVTKVYWRFLGKSLSNLHLKSVIFSSKFSRHFSSSFYYNFHCYHLGLVKPSFMFCQENKIVSLHLIAVVIIPRFAKCNYIVNLNFWYAFEDGLRWFRAISIKTKKLIVDKFR